MHVKVSTCSQAWASSEQCTWFEGDDHVFLELPAEAQALQAGPVATVG